MFALGHPGSSPSLVSPIFLLNLSYKAPHLTLLLQGEVTARRRLLGGKLNTQHQGLLKLPEERDQSVQRDRAPSLSV